ncbi:MAG: PSD1 and planctomycete cytochrome C domain-containing protein [Fimbriimonas sp.]
MLIQPFLKQLAFATAMSGLWLLGSTYPQKEPQHRVSFGDVQPILTAHCTRCHGDTNPAAGLSLTSFKGLITGKIVIPGNANKSILLDRLLGKGGLPQMPMGFTAISDRELTLIRTWIDEGALDTVAKRKHWAYIKPVRPRVPKVNQPTRNPIDAFVLERLEKEHLKPSPEADKTTLIRRLTLDLTGLPPTPEEVDAFLVDNSSNAYEKVVDRLFASPHYGERMALPWLDAARYADSNGFQMDGDTYQYVWRDWVVRAMNANMPFDQFTTLQIAGDLTPGASSASQQGRDALIATGFNRNHMLNGEGGAIPEEQRNVALFDRVDTTATTWLGLTMTCTRCHDHKYDPLTQKDYFSMMAYFNQVPESGVPDGGVPYSIAKPWIYAGTQQQMARMAAIEALLPAVTAKANKLKDAPDTQAARRRWEAAPGADLPKEIADILKLEKRSPEQQSKLHEYFLDHALSGPEGDTWKRYRSLQKELDTLRKDMPRVMIMNDRQRRQTHIYSRGNYEEPLDKVSPATPETLPAIKAPKNRLGLAKWIVSPTNPLTARVQVNRYWQLFFGKGLVRTPENFGVQGEPPTHPELLDWLAVEFEENGWNVKAIQRLIVTSSTYRQSSRVSPTMAKRDPDNRFLARAARFRLPAMLLRDEALAASGLIDVKIGGKPVYPYQPKGIWDGLAITDARDFTYPQSKGKDLHRRSIYSFWRRTVAPGNMFDAASRQICTVRQSLTSTPLHALTTLNDTTWVEAGRALAERIMKTERDEEGRLTLAFRFVCARKPDKQELAILRRSLSRSNRAFTNDPKSAEAFLSQGESARAKNLNAIEHAAYASVCLAILNLDEALTRE